MKALFRDRRYDCNSGRVQRRARDQPKPTAKWAAAEFAQNNIVNQRNHRVARHDWKYFRRRHRVQGIQVPKIPQTDRETTYHPPCNGMRVYIRCTRCLRFEDFPKTGATRPAVRSHPSTRARADESDGGNRADLAADECHERYVWVFCCCTVAMSERKQR